MNGGYTVKPQPDKQWRGSALKLSLLKHSSEIQWLRLADGEAERWRHRIMAPYFFQIPAECCARHCCPWRQPRDLELIYPRATRSGLQCSLVIRQPSYVFCADLNRIRFHHRNGPTNIRLYSAK